MSDPVRETLQTLIERGGEDYASLSRLIGRNPAYIQQFMKRGAPRRLAEEDRRILARYFGVAETVLGGPTPESRSVANASEPRALGADLVVVPRYAVGASAGSGAEADDAPTSGGMAFPPTRLRELSGSKPAALSLIRVDGSSMSPTLEDGDDILVDRDDAAERLRDGIYVLRVDEALIVKRISCNPATRRIHVRSDNVNHADWGEMDPADVAIIGRVVWTGHRVA